MDSLQSRHDKLAAKIRFLQALIRLKVLPEVAEKQPMNIEAGCAELQSRLPACVEAELSGLEHRECHDVGRELLYCRNCALEYLWLLKLSLLDEQGQIPTPLHTPALDISFMHSSGNTGR